MDKSKGSETSLIALLIFFQAISALVPEIVLFTRNNYFWMTLCTVHKIAFLESLPYLLRFLKTTRNCFLCRLLHEAADQAKNAYADDVSLLPGVASSSTVEHNPDTSSGALVQFISYPGVWCICFFFLMASCPFGLFDVALGPYLLDTFGIDGDTAGFYFLSMGALYAVMTQVVGFLVDKGKLLTTKNK